MHGPVGHEPTLPEGIRFPIRLMTKTSPHYLQANEQAEKTLEMAKQQSCKAKDSGQDLYLTLLEYQNPPSCGLLYSPAEVLMHPETRTSLLMNIQQLSSKIAGGMKDLQTSQRKQKKLLDGNSYRLQEAYKTNRENWKKKRHCQIILASKGTGTQCLNTRHLQTASGHISAKTTTSAGQGWVGERQLPEPFLGRQNWADTPEQIGPMRTRPKLNIKPSA